MKIRPVGADLFHAERQTKMTKLIVVLHCFANASKKDCGDTQTRNLQLQILQPLPRATENCRMYWTEDSAQE
jgi:hypothetical protein